MYCQTCGGYAPQVFHQAGRQERLCSCASYRQYTGGLSDAFRKESEVRIERDIHQIKILLEMYLKPRMMKFNPETEEKQCKHEPRFQHYEFQFGEKKINGSVENERIDRHTDITCKHCGVKIKAEKWVEE